MKKKQGEHFEKQNVHSSYVMDTNFYFGNVPPNTLEKKFIGFLYLIASIYTYVKSSSFTLKNAKIK